MNTTTVSIEIPTKFMQHFESFESVHHRNLSDALEIGMKEILNNIQKIEEIRFTIDKTEHKLNKLRAELDESTQVYEHGPASPCQHCTYLTDGHHCDLHNPEGWMA